MIGAGRDVLHLQPADEPEELVGAQGVVRRLAAQEVGVLLHGPILTRPRPDLGTPPVSASRKRSGKVLSRSADAGCDHGQVAQLVRASD